MNFGQEPVSTNASRSIKQPTSSLQQTENDQTSQNFSSSHVERRKQVNVSEASMLKSSDQMLPCSSENPMSLQSQNTNKINFQKMTQVAGSSENVSLQQKSDHVDMVAQTIGGELDKEIKVHLIDNVQGTYGSISEVASGTVFSQKSAVSTGKRPPPAVQPRGRGNQNDPSRTATGHVNVKTFLMNSQSSKSNVKYQSNTRTSSRGDIMHKRGTEHEDSITKLHEQIVSQTNSQSQIPMSPQKTQQSREQQATYIVQLLRGFKLTQYATKMTDYGYGEDIYRLAFLSHREREDLMCNMKMLPGHKERMSNLFNVIEKLNPKTQIKKNLNLASKQAEGKPANMVIQEPTSAVKITRQRSSSRRGFKERTSNQSPEQEATQDNSKNPFVKAGDVRTSLNGQIVFGHDHTAQFIQQLSDAGTRADIKGGSRISIPQEGGKPARGNSRKKQSESDSLTRMFNQLEFPTRTAMNEQFLTNIKSGRNHQSFHKALQNYVERPQEQKKAKNALNAIFPKSKFKQNVKESKQQNQIYLNKQDQPQVYTSENVKPMRERKSSQPASGGTNAGMPRPPLGQQSAQRPKKSQRPPQAQGQGANRNAGTLQTQKPMSSNPPRPGGYEKFETPDKSSASKNQSGVYLTQIKQNNMARRSSRDRSMSQSKEKMNVTQVKMVRGGSQRRAINTLIPTVTTQTGASSRRSREGSNIGRGTGSSFFNRRNSAKGLRNSNLSVNLGENTQASFNQVSKEVSASRQLNTSSNLGLREINLQIQTEKKNMAEASDNSILPVVITPSEIVRASQMGVNSQPADITRHSEVVGIHQNNFSLMEDPLQCKTIDDGEHRTKMTPSRRSSRVSNSHRGATPAYSTPNDALVQNNFNQQMQEEIDDIEKNEKDQRVSNIQQSVQSPQKSVVQNSVRNSLQSLGNASTPIQSPFVQVKESPKMQLLPPKHQDAVNDMTSPLLDKGSQQEAMNYGYSFNSKKVAQGPMFFNLRIMCHCLGKAIKCHTEFSRQTHWFLDDLNDEKAKDHFINQDLQHTNPENDLDQSSFSYQFQDELKITTDKKKMDEMKKTKKSQRQSTLMDKTEDDYTADDFEEPGENVEDLEVSLGNPFKQQKNFHKSGNPELNASVKESSYSQEFANRKEQMHNNPAIRINDCSDEDIQERDDDDIDDLDLDVRELREIEKIRRDELFKQTMTREKDRLQNISTDKEYLHQQLKEKDEKIQELTKMVQMLDIKNTSNVPSAQMQEILAVSGQVSRMSNKINQEMDLDDFDDGEQMTKAEFLMAQLDLDPIESMYSQEQKQITEHNLMTRLSESNQYTTALQSIQKQQSEVRPQIQKPVDQTMGNGSFNSVSQGISLRSSTGPQNINESGTSVDNLNKSGVFKSPNLGQNKKPPKVMSKSQQKFFNAKINTPQTEEKDQKQKQKEQELYDRQQQMAVLRDSLRFFDERMEFDTEVFNEDLEILEPSEADIAAYSKYVTVASKMENETPIIALVYIERMLKKTGILLNKYNWKRILLVCLCVASKVWDDDSLENIHFPKVMADVSLLMINKIEQIFLDLFLNYDLVVKGSEYAKYYFIMRTLADELRDETQAPDEKNHPGKKKRRKRDDWAEFPLQKPISADQMAQLQKNAAKAEIYLKDRYELQVIEALGDKFKGKNQKERMRKLDSTI